MKFGITDIITTVVNTPGRALARSFIDNVIRDRVEPVIGSILYCDLALGYIEHSGIYVGGGNKCIVPLRSSQVPEPDSAFTFPVKVPMPSAGRKSQKPHAVWWGSVSADIHLPSTTVICFLITV